MNLCYLARAVGIYLSVCSCPYGSFRFDAVASLCLDRLMVFTVLISVVAVSLKKGMSVDLLMSMLICCVR